MDRLYQEDTSDAGQGEIHSFEKSFLVQAAIENSAEPDGGKYYGEGIEVVVGDCGRPQTGEVKSDHREDAGRQEISLQGGAKLLR